MYLTIPKGGAFKVEDVLWAINNPEKAKERFWIRIYRQGDIPKGKRWLDLLFSPYEILDLLKQSPLIKRVSEYFDPSYGNITYLYLTSIGKIRGVRNIGGNEFFYLTEADVRREGIPQEFLYPLLPSSRYLKTFTFTQSDWRVLKERGVKCYLFLCHKRRNELPESVRKYIEKGESPDAQIRLRRRPGEDRGRPVSESLASQTRCEHSDVFFGWYDLGGVVEAPIIASRYARYWHRFTLATYAVACDDDVMALIPLKSTNLSLEELKALLAYLNSSIMKLYLEASGRTAGGVGPLALEANVLRDAPILDVRRLPKRYLEELARLFDELETETRRLGGADAVESVFGSELAKDLTGREDVQDGIQGLFNTVIRKIDEKVASVLEAEALVEPVRTLVVELTRRRLARASEAKPGALKGSEELLHRPKRKGSKRKGKKGRGDEAGPSTRLDDFT
jgi:hypothetical protein